MVELVHVVPKEEQGSWVGLTVDDQGRLLATDQYGGLYRLTPSPLGKKEGTVVEKLEVELTGAHGLLYAFDSLYALVNETREEVGLWRLRDTQGTGQFDEKTLLRTIRGSGEHGVHSLALAPDGKSLYIACGNGTGQPEPLNIHGYHVRSVMIKSCRGSTKAETSRIRNLMPSPVRFLPTGNTSI